MDFIEICDKKIYTDLDNGNSKRVIYSLCKSVINGKTVFGIKIETQRNSEKNSCILEDISSDEKTVVSIMNCLIQNGVDDICMHEVVTDLLHKV